MKYNIQYCRGEIATFLTIVFFGLMALGIGVGTKLVQTPTKLNTFACVTQCAICNPNNEGNLCHPTDATRCRVVTFCNGNAKWCWDPDNTCHPGNLQPTNTPGPTSPPAPTNPPGATNTPQPTQPPSINCPGEWECNLNGNIICSDGLTTRNTFKATWCDGQGRWKWQAANSSTACDGNESIERTVVGIPYPTPCNQSPTVRPTANLSPIKSPTPSPEPPQTNWIRCTGGFNTCNDFCGSVSKTCFDGDKGGLRQYDWFAPDGKFGKCDQTISPGNPAEKLNKYCNMAYNVYCNCSNTSTPVPTAAPTVAPGTGTIRGIVNFTANGSSYDQISVGLCEINGTTHSGSGCQDYYLLNVSSPQTIDLPGLYYGFDNLVAGKKYALAVNVSLNNKDIAYSDRDTDCPMAEKLSGPSDQLYCVVQATGIQNFNLSIPSTTVTPTTAAGTGMISGKVTINGTLPAGKYLRVIAFDPDNIVSTKYSQRFNASGDYLIFYRTGKIAIGLSPHYFDIFGNNLDQYDSAWNTTQCNTYTTYKGICMITLPPNGHIVQNVSINIPASQPTIQKEGVALPPITGSTNTAYAKTIDLWVSGQISALQMSAFISQTTRVPGVQMQTCDPMLPANNIKSCSYIPPAAI